MEHIEYRLEEKTGDGEWSEVYDSKEESGFMRPSRKSFETAEQAWTYVESGRWKSGALAVVRVVRVRTLRTVLEAPPKTPKKAGNENHERAEDYDDAFGKDIEPDEEEDAA
jgi:uncharacterized NAD(P)/FAD-binding protein YdhS